MRYLQYSFSSERSANVAVPHAIRERSARPNNASGAALNQADMLTAGAIVPDSWRNTADTSRSVVNNRFVYGTLTDQFHVLMRCGNGGRR